jgi:hypothetical protein
MFDRISVTITIGTLLAILGKLVQVVQNAPPKSDPNAFIHALYNLHNQKIFRADLALVLVLIFLFFFRGKMMHDDHQYFVDIEKGRYRGAPSSVNHFGLLLGYLSWLAWGPALYYFPHWKIFSTCMIVSLSLSTIWAAIDQGQIPPDSPRFATKKQYGWIAFNVTYIGLFAVLGFLPAGNDLDRLFAAIILLCVLIVDWWFSAPIASNIEIGG